MSSPLANPEVLALLNKPLWESSPGDYAELLNEDDPNGTVVLRRANGEAFAQMPREVWDAARG